MSNQKAENFPVTNKRFSKELQLVRRMIGMDGERKSLNSLSIMQRDLESVLKGKPHRRAILTEMLKRLKKVLAKAKKLKASDVDISLDAKFKSKLAKNNNPKPRMKVEYLDGIDQELLYGLECLPFEILEDRGLGFTKEGQQKIYDMVTEMILKVIKENKELPWRKPWSIKSILATNFKTKTVYKGANLFLLNLIAPILYGKVGPYWLTFKQIKDLGGTLKKGSTGFPVIYYSVYHVVNKPEKKRITEEEYNALTKQQKADREAKELWTINYYNVFPQEDITGIKFPNLFTKRDGKPIETAKAIVDGMPKRPEIFHHNSGRAYYSPVEDHIKLPKISYFKTDQEYYSTLFHELIHSTGHESRLDRFEDNKKVADDDYAYEELIAELGASYLNAEAGILYHTMKNSAAYLKGWQTKLENALESDNKFFLKAAAKASQAAEFILDREKKGTPPVKSSKKVKAKKSRRPVAKNRRVEKSEERVSLNGPDQAIVSPVATPSSTPVITTPKPVEQKKILVNKAAIENDDLFKDIDDIDQSLKDTFRLNGDLGVFLGDLEEYQLAFTLTGDQGAGKTQFAFQLADGFAEIGKTVGFFELEIGAESNIVKKYRDQYIRPENRSKVRIAGKAPKGIDTIREYSKKYNVIIIDSWTSLDVDSSEFNKLREDFPDTVFIILFQLTSGKSIRGGTKPLFDAGANLHVHKVDSTFVNNYVEANKNRYGRTGIKYNVSRKELIDENQSMPNSSSSGTVQEEVIQYQS